MWLSLVGGIGRKRYKNLIEQLKTNKAIFNASKNELMNIKLINDKVCNNILDINKRKTAEMHLKYMEKNKIDIIFINDEEYPYNLKKISDPPLYLYIKGNKKLLKNRNIAIIGCRDCSSYGRDIAKKFAYDLALCDINIISGLAIGIDSYAHIGAIIARGYTTAVLGNSLDSLYPKENIYLAKKIIEQNGLIISEYPLGTKTMKLNFPARNRIISGLSEGIVVVEAKKKSGTLITVDFALEQGREVFVVPR